MGHQAPLGSGFGLHTTAAEVLEGIDLSGRRALVTGGYSGIGIEMVRALLAAGTEEVLVPARRPELAAEAIAALPEDARRRVTLGAMDLADQAGVASYAETVLALGGHLDIVIDSAGIMAVREQHVGPGWELHFATNHLGHYALVNRLWPLLDGGARVISVSSGGHQFSGIRWEDPWFTGGYDKWQAYGQSKTANVLFAVGLDRRGAAHGVRAFSLHPGAILTPLGRHLEHADMEALLSYGSDGEPLLPELKSPEAGAATAVWGATSPLLDGLGGLYLEDCDVAPVADPEQRVTGQALGVFPHATDPEQAERLWAFSAELTGLDAFA